LSPTALLPISHNPSNLYNNHDFVFYRLPILLLLPSLIRSDLTKFLESLENLFEKNRTIFDTNFDFVEEDGRESSERRSES